MTSHQQECASGTGPLLGMCPVVPVVVIRDPAHARPLGEALLAGGITVVEITLRTPAAMAAIREMSGVPGLTVGAGTVLSADRVDDVVRAGAQFVVSPGLSALVVDRARASGVSVLPGVATATELMAAMALGLTEVKFFPAGLLGGAATIAALAAPFAGVSFMPSGGVGPDNMHDYLELACVPAVSGSWMVSPASIEARRWDEVTALSREAVARAVSRTDTAP